MDSAHVSRHVSAQQGDGRAPHRQAAFTERRKMRLIPLLTALLVTVVLYLAVFQRDAMLAFALGEAGAQQTETETGGADGVATVPAATDAVRVVVLRSQARTVDSASAPAIAANRERPAAISAASSPTSRCGLCPPTTSCTARAGSAPTRRAIARGGLLAWPKGAK